MEIDLKVPGACFHSPINSYKMLLARKYFINHTDRKVSSKSTYLSYSLTLKSCSTHKEATGQGAGYLNSLGNFHSYSK